MNKNKYEAVVIGASAGGSAALAQLLPRLPPTFPLAVIIVRHLHPLQAGLPFAYQTRDWALPVKEADEKEPVRPGWIYFAPPNYHLLIESDRTFALSIDERVNYVRPSIDVLFESAAEVYGAGLVGVILSGANQDGAAGLRRIKERGGLAVVQDPATAEVALMPQAALAMAQIDYVLPPAEIGALLARCGAACLNV